MILQQTGKNEINVVHGISQVAESNRGPISLRLRRALPVAIETGLLPTGCTLPAERQLAAGLEISRLILRDCLAGSDIEGQLVTRHGFGTVAAGPPRKALMRLSGFTQYIPTREQVARSCVTGRLIGPVSPDMAFRTGLLLTTDVTSLSRQRLADDEGLSIERVSVPLMTVGADFDGTGLLYEQLAKNGLRPTPVLQKLSAVSAPASIGLHLAISRGHRCCKSRGSAVTSRGRPWRTSRAGSQATGTVIAAKTSVKGKSYNNCRPVSKHRYSCSLLDHRR